MERTLYDLYERHIVRLFPLLSRLSARGMPVDYGRREAYAHLLAHQQATTLAALVAAVPLSARRIAHVYKNEPRVEDLPTLLGRPGTRPINLCASCGARKPGKSHFRVLKKKPNPCAGAGIRQVVESVTEWYRLADWRPSRDQLLTYCKVKWIKPPRRRDGDHWKITFDEDAIRKLRLRLPDDPVFAGVLTYRELDKIAGTYIGRPDGVQA